MDGGNAFPTLLPAEVPDIPLPPLPSGKSTPPPEEKAGMFSKIKDKVSELAESPAGQAAKNLINSAEQKAIDKKIDKDEKLNSKIDDLLGKLKGDEAEGKLEKLGVNLFNPKSVMDHVKDHIEEEIDERLDLHKELEEKRDELLKKKSEAEQKILKEVASELTSRAQDGSCTAVVDGMLDALTPDSIKNPAGGESEEESTSPETDAEYYDDSASDMYQQLAEGKISYDDIKAANIHGESEPPPQEEKKGFFGAAADMFGQAMDKAKDVASSAFNTTKEVGGNIFSAAKDMALSGTGVKEDALFVSNAVSFVTGNVSKAVNFARDTISSSASNYLNSTPEEKQIRDGLLAAIKKDATNSLIDKTIENSISILGAGISDNNKNIANVSDAVNNVSNKIMDNATKASGTSDKNMSTESVQAAVASTTIHMCGVRGNTNNVRKLTERADVPYENNKAALQSAVENSKQTPEDVTNLLLIANLLGISIDNVNSNNLKPPDKTSNNTSSSEKAGQTQQQNKEFIDLPSFKDITNAGTNLAKTVLGIDQTNYCQAVGNNANYVSKPLKDGLPELEL
jgi:hypothetical protein